MPLKISDKKRTGNFLSFLPFLQARLPPSYLPLGPAWPAVGAAPAPLSRTEADTTLFAGLVKRAHWRSLSVDPTAAADSMVPRVSASR